MLAASRAAPWGVTLSMRHVPLTLLTLEKIRDRQTDGRQTETLLFATRGQCNKPEMLISLEVS